MIVSRQLLEKYNQGVPRYTSYPPANLFTNFSHDEYVKALGESNSEQPSNISIYIHIPFCNKICFYCGCNSMRIGQAETVRQYIEAIKKEILMVKRHLQPNRQVSQIHYGGGTPNAIPVDYLLEINHLIFDNFAMMPNAEVAIECHPAHLSHDTINKLAEAGFNRISLGIQDFNNEVLKAVNREPSHLPVAEIINRIKQLNPQTGINLDFIYGLPLQTPESFARTMQQAVELNPDRIVTFSYAHVPWVKSHMKALEKLGLPDAETKMQVFEQAYHQMTSNGYIEVGMDHYAKPEDELVTALNNNDLHRNFQGYCTRHTTGQVYAFGVSGISQLTNAYAQNTKELEAYINAINNDRFAVEKGYAVNQRQQMIRQVINQVMCNMRVEWAPTAALFNTDVTSLLEAISFDAKRFDALVADNMVILTPQGIEVTPSGHFFIRNVAVALDPDYKGGNSIYSKAV
jgi:oxygen-independent coproporphyrinogen-3 oxidase